MRPSRPAPWTVRSTTPGLRAVALAVLLLVVLLGGQGRADASWVVAGSGPSRGAATQVPQGNQPSGTKPLLSTTATVAWAGTSVLGSPATGYVVRRYSGTTPSPMTGGTCVGSTVAGVPNVVPTTSCTDDRGVTGGTFTYTVQPVYRSWLGLPSPASPAV